MQLFALMNDCTIKNKMGLVFAIIHKYEQLHTKEQNGNMTCNHLHVQMIAEQKSKMIFFCNHSYM